MSLFHFVQIGSGQRGADWNPCHPGLEQGCTGAEAAEIACRTGSRVVNCQGRSKRGSSVILVKGMRCSFIAFFVQNLGCVDHPDSE
jgi:hypothetical protein